MSRIHPTAIVEPGAKIDSDVEIGPYCHVGGGVEIHSNVVLRAHVVIGGKTEIGEETEVYPFAALGLAPQDLKYQGEESRLIIGRNNRIRENVTMNTGTLGGGMETRVGDGCLFMAGSHVAHDCIVGNQVILANNATLAGHVTVGDFAILGGLSAVHQYVRIGRHSMIGGMTGVENDVIPFGSVMGNRAYLNGLNLLGLKRRGFDRQEIAALRAAYEKLFVQEGTLSERVDRVAADFADSPVVNEVVSFIRTESGRALCQPKSGDAR